MLKEKRVYLTYTANTLLKLKECYIFFSQGELIFFSFYHNKIHPVTNYKAIKNKIKQDNTGQKIFLNK